LTPLSASQWWLKAEGRTSQNALAVLRSSEGWREWPSIIDSIIASIRNGYGLLELDIAFLVKRV
jgi:hypothetical protein